MTDIVRLVLSLMDEPKALGRVFNVGSDQPVRILDLAQRVIDAVDPALGVQFVSYAEAYSEDFEDCRHRVPNLDRLHSVVDYRPEYDLDAVLREVIAWKRRQMQAESTRRTDQEKLPRSSTPS